MEDERKQRSLATSARNKLMGDLKDLEGQLEMSNKVKDDAVKQYKRAQSQSKEYLRELDELRISREEMANSFKDNERKIKNLEAELLKVQEELSMAERARRNAEGERDELADELTTLASGK